MLQNFTKMPNSLILILTGNLYWNCLHFKTLILFYGVPYSLQNYKITLIWGKTLFLSKLKFCACCLKKKHVSLLSLPGDFWRLKDTMKPQIIYLKKPSHSLEVPKDHNTQSSLGLLAITQLFLRGMVTTP